MKYYDNKDSEYVLKSSGLVSSRLDFYRQDNIIMSLYPKKRKNSIEWNLFIDPFLENDITSLALFFIILAEHINIAYMRIPFGAGGTSALS